MPPGSGHGTVTCVIEVNELTKRYGAATAAAGLAFTVNPGHVTGFLGPNGAGKSTTLRMMPGLSTPTSGTVRVDGQPFRAPPRGLRPSGHCSTPTTCTAGAARGRIARAHLSAPAHSNGLPRLRVDEVLEEVGPATAARRRIGGFSLGKPGGIRHPRQAAERDRPHTRRRRTGPRPHRGGRGRPPQGRRRVHGDRPGRGTHR
ncbi:ATP-binding cassette domain-containing protein [Streptomyces sp. NPDC015127]|uniref:ATP-binding cassette domain-containing protein n=1 Tax=Streptomyces sp. NPDC015127 TaxID=3364939 RepID=UPI00370198AE